MVGMFSRPSECGATASSAERATNHDAEGYAAPGAVARDHQPILFSCRRSLHEREAGRDTEGGDVAAFFGDVHVAVLVDAQQIRDQIRRNRADDLAVARAHHVHLVLGHEQRAIAQHRLEAPRLIRVHVSREHLVVAQGAVRRI